MTYDELEKQYGANSSLVLWENTDDLKTKDSIADTTSVVNELKADTYNKDFIFVALNPATKTEENTPSWRNFHSDESGSRDHMLRYALHGTRYWGAFITDLLYDIPGRESKDVLAEYNQKTDEEKHGYIERIRKIRNTINETAIIIAIGSDAYELLKERLDDKEQKCLKKITHFSFKYLSIECYRSVVLTQLENDKSMKHITKKSVNDDLPDIGNINIKDMINRFDNEQKANENAVGRCFKDLGNEYSDVLIKTIVLNNRYSAGLTDHPQKNLLGQNNPVDVITMADFITSNASKIKSYVSKKDVIGLIECMRKIGEGKEYVSPYSFVTKYCSWQYPKLDVYIVDGYSKGILYYYNLKDKYYSRVFNQYELNNYKTYYDVYKSFFNHYEALKPLTTAKEKDKFIWQLGKSLNEEGLDVRIY